MNKSTLIKCVVAAVLAVPAIPTFAKVVHRRALVRRPVTHRLVVTAVKRHVYHTVTHRPAKLIVHRQVTKHTLTATHHVVRKVSANSKTPFHVHFTKMPPTIDGINA